ncbi:MAG: 6-pyruvoyl trahydropterin synthase family protein [Planctomycetota bacterium]
MLVRYQTEFSAAHRLMREDWSATRNQEVFGPCARGHGHNYGLEVTIEGPVMEECGMVMNFNDLEAHVKTRLLDHVDHRDLDKDVPFLNGILSTAENLLKAFWNPLATGLPEGVRLHALSLRETRDFTCTYYGPDDA